MIISVSLLGFFLFGTAANILGDESASFSSDYGGIFLKLTEDFYRVLREESEAGTRTYGTDTSEEYLRQIAISAKFMVENNLQILRQQETIIRLLQSFCTKKR